MHHPTYLRGTASDLLPQTLRWGLLIGQQHTEELLQLRSGLEIYVARLAAMNADSDALAALGGHLERMRESGDDLRAFAAADRDFHLALASAAGNRTIVDLLDVARSLLQVYADRAVETADEAKAAIDEHTAIFSAVREQDEDRAASAMAAHMATATARVTGLNR